jgi:hypothetical protein
MVVAVDKNEILKWSRKYDRDAGFWLQKEQAVGARFRRAKTMTLEDLAAIVEWKFRDSEEKRKRTLELVARNSEAEVTRVSSQVFCVTGCEDAYRVNCLTMLVGVSPVLASIVLAFFEPKIYGVFDAAVWRGLLGNEPPNLYSTANYLRLLAALRKTAARYNVEVRTVEKALSKQSADKKKS